MELSILVIGVDRKRHHAAITMKMSNATSCVVMAWNRRYFVAKGLSELSPLRWLRVQALTWLRRRPHGVELCQTWLVILIQLFDYRFQILQGDDVRRTVEIECRSRSWRGTVVTCHKRRTK